MIVDSHHHLWDLTAHPYPWLHDPAVSRIRRTFTLDDLRPRMVEAGVGRGVVVEGGAGDLAETRTLLALAERSDHLAGVVGAVDLRSPTMAGYLEDLRSGPSGRYLLGLRDQVQEVPEPGFLLEPEVVANLSRIADAGLTYDLVVRPHQLPDCAAAADRVPELTFVLDHLGKPAVRDGAAGLRTWTADVTALAARPNVHAKLSGLVTEADPLGWSAEDLRPFVETAIELFGPHRLMYGSDWPVCLLAGVDYLEVTELLDWLLASLTSSERRAVFAGTAVRTYRLDVGAEGRPTGGP